MTQNHKEINRPFDPAPGQNMKIKYLGSLMILILILLAIEGISFLFINYLLPHHKVAYLMFKPPVIPREERYARYLIDRDPVMGWPLCINSNNDCAHHVISRPIPSFPEPGHECVSIYGDSFTYADDVSDEEAWSSALSETLGCRVANFGIPGYGTDQALLLFERNKEDAAPLTILGIYPDNFRRNVNQYRYFLETSGWSSLAFKPRFRMSTEGNLKLIDLPTIPYKEFGLFAKKPYSYLKDEFFIPGTSYGQIPLKFPFTFAVAQIVMKPEFKNWILGQPDWIDFIQPKHASEALEITVGIAQRFNELCRERGKRCLILTFPARNSYDYYIDTGKDALQPFLDELDRSGISSLNLTPMLSKKLNGRNICEILSHPAECTGHFNPEGNRFVAEILETYIKEKHAEALLNKRSKDISLQP